MGIDVGNAGLIGKFEEIGAEGIDPESRMRLRSIDVQLLRILEEMAAGREEVMADLRGDLAALSRAVRQGGREVRETPPQETTVPPRSDAEPEQLDLARRLSGRTVPSGRTGEEG